MDLTGERSISKDEAMSFALSNGMKYFEVSANQNLNIKECIEEIIAQSYDFKKDYVKNANHESL